MKDQLVEVGITHTATEAKRLFASQFQLDDWYLLCQNQKFLKALDEEEFKLADVIGWQILNQASPITGTAAAEAHVKHKQLHAAAMELVGIWAKKFGRMGKAGKQSRQNHIRKLMKHGLDSDYARKMMAEAID